jgi:hypothetical protein
VILRIDAAGMYRAGHTFFQAAKRRVADRSRPSTLDRPDAYVKVRRFGLGCVRERPGDLRYSCDGDVRALFDGQRMIVVLELDERAGRSAKADRPACAV